MEVIVVPEARKLQMVVVGSKEEAESVKAEIDSGKITIFQAAQQYSLDPNAKQTLDEMGWVSQGTGFPELDDISFGLEPDVIGGPVESPAGWHLVKVLDVKDAQHQDIDDPKTRKLTKKMYIDEKLDSYVVDLRKHSFKVAVYDDVLNQNFQTVPGTPYSVRVSSLYELQIHPAATPSGRPPGETHRGCRSRSASARRVGSVFHKYSKESHRVRLD